MPLPAQRPALPPPPSSSSSQLDAVNTEAFHERAQTYTDKAWAMSIPHCGLLTQIGQPSTQSTYLRCSTLRSSSSPGRIASISPASVRPVMPRSPTPWL